MTVLQATEPSCEEASPRMPSIFLCHRCPYFDRQRGKAGRCNKEPFANLSGVLPLKKYHCNLLTPGQLDLLNHSGFIPISSNVSVKPNAWTPNRCFECGAVVSRRSNHQKRRFCKTCALRLNASRRRNKT
jgi:hypothetical protein